MEQADVHSTLRGCHGRVVSDMHTIFQRDVEQTLFDPFLPEVRQIINTFTELGAYLFNNKEEHTYEVADERGLTCLANQKMVKTAVSKNSDDMTKVYLPHQMRTWVLFMDAWKAIFEVVV